jgi:hypothetical protein
MIRSGFSPAATALRIFATASGSSSRSKVTRILRSAPETSACLVYDDGSIALTVAHAFSLAVAG